MAAEAPPHQDIDGFKNVCCTKVLEVNEAFTGAKNDVGHYEICCPTVRQ